MSFSRTVEILLAEDNPGDARLTLEALKDGRIPTHLHHVSDGEQVLQFLYQEGPYAQAPVPDLILLDLNLPRKNGREVLEILKTDATLKSIPVIVLTTSSARDDIRSCYALGANSYIVKPIEFEQFISVVRAFEAFWLDVAALPRR